jgi:hypothetical protein
MSIVETKTEDGGGEAFMVNLLPGRSAYSLVGPALLSLPVFAVIVTLTFIFMGMYDGPGTPKWIVDAGALSAVGLVLWCGVIGVLNVWLRLRQSRELAAGYTTSVGEKRTVPLVHPSTGEILCAAGEPSLTWREYRAAIARINEAAADE